ncbi:MAG: hypothetical protein NC111_06210 [Bacteroides sp.]|nr:hypothetical protein [Bacteroides sp.]MCM1413157.1 hypothetical protein [Bacteroides sp.]MCM1472101.1 hypothetical protein [Bacteroides sp.]
MNRSTLIEWTAAAVGDTKKHVAVVSQSQIVDQTVLLPAAVVVQPHALQRGHVAVEVVGV